MRMLRAVLTGTRRLQPPVIRRGLVFASIASRLQRTESPIR
jgi:hypothetical protein